MSTMPRAAGPGEEDWPRAAGPGEEDWPRAAERDGEEDWPRAAGPGEEDWPRAAGPGEEDWPRAAERDGATVLRVRPPPLEPAAQVTGLGTLVPPGLRSGVAIPTRMAITTLRLGRLDEALAWAELGFRRTGKERHHAHYESLLNTVVGQVHLERDEIDAASEAARAAVRPVQPATTSPALVHALLLSARVAAAADRIGETKDLLEHARSAVLTGPVDEQLQRALVMDHVGALLDIGEAAQAQLWETSLAHYARTDIQARSLFLRLQIDAGEHTEIGDAALRLLRELSGDECLRTRIQVGTASAAALEVAGRRGEALPIFRVTVGLADHQKFVRSVAEYGEVVEPLLGALAKERNAPHDHVALLRRAASRAADQTSGDLALGVSAPDARDNLTERELQVLRLLGGTLSNREIGNELYLSVNTVKTHVKSVYAKLGVNKRSQAVVKARELGILRHPSMST